MRHMKRGRKLGRKAPHRKAMLSNMATSLLQHERIATTVQKAKELRGVVERLITYGKKGTLAALRLAARRINNKDVLKKLFSDVAPSYKDRVGGYVRIVKTTRRKGDDAEMCLIELVGRQRKVAASQQGSDASRTSKPKTGESEQSVDSGKPEPTRAKTVKKKAAVKKNTEAATE